MRVAVSWIELNIRAGLCEKAKDSFIFWCLIVYQFNSSLSLTLALSVALLQNLCS